MLIPPVGELPDKYASKGVITFNVECALWKKEPQESPLRHEMKLIHLPEEDNYAHSEVRTFKNGKYYENKDVGELIKKEYRARIAKCALVLLTPTR